MKKKNNNSVITAVAIAGVILVALVAIFVGGGNEEGPLSDSDALKIVLNDLGVKESKADSIHVHTAEENGIPCYLIYITVDGHNWEYLVNGLTGEILEKEASDHSHSH